MKVILAAVFAAAFGTLLPATVRAETGTVFYKDGGRVSGELVEVHPGKFVVVKTAAGETRRIEWEEVDHVADAATAPAPSPVPAPVAPAEELATLVVRSTAPSSVVQEITGHSMGTGYGYRTSVTVMTTMYADLCTAPCSAKVKLGVKEIMVSAPGAPAAYGRLELHKGENFYLAKMGSSGLMLGGVMSLSVGITGALVGAGLIGLSSIGESLQGLFAPGLVTTIAGVALTGGGIAMLVLGPSSLIPDPEHAVPTPAASQDVSQSSGLPVAHGLSLAGRF